MLKKKDKYQTVLSIYSILFACNLLINVDHGTIPAATVKLKTDLGIDNVALGLLGSLVFFGLTLGNISIQSIRFPPCNSDIHLLEGKAHPNGKFRSERLCPCPLHSSSWNIHDSGNIKIHGRLLLGKVIVLTT